MKSIEFCAGNCSDVLTISVTNDRTVAAERIAQGYEPFTVPQMFKEESGQIVLILREDAKQGRDGMSILEEYENDSRRIPI